MLDVKIEKKKELYKVYKHYSVYNIYKKVDNEWVYLYKTCYWNRLPQIDVNEILLKKARERIQKGVI